MATHKNNDNSKITIYDIAKELGLSPSTVGHALNGTGRISENTRDRVTLAAAKMGYQPSLVAKSLSNNRTFTIGVIVPSISIPAYSAMVNGVESVAYDAGYNIILCCSQFDQQREAQYLQMLRNRRVEGIVIIPTRRVISHKKQLEQLIKIDDSGLPLVVLEQNIHEENLTKVVMDNFNGAKKITNHLISLGHKNIGFLNLGYEETDFAGNERFAGYKAALSEAGLQFHEQLAAQGATITSLEDEQYPSDSFARYYEDAGRPSAIFAVCDALAIKIIRDCNLMGLKVPEDIAIAGFDNIQLAGLINPPLTTVQQPARDMGKRAADIVLGRIDGRIEYQVSEKVQGKLVIRESCGVKLQSHESEERITIK